MAATRRQVGAQGTTGLSRLGCAVGERIIYYHAIRLWRNSPIATRIARLKTRSGPWLPTGPKRAPASAPWRGGGLLDLGFLELDMLADFRVVLPQGELLGRAARVLLGRIEVPGAGRAHELDQHRSGLGHDERSLRGRGELAREVSLRPPAVKVCPAERWSRDGRRLPPRGRAREVPGPASAGRRPARRGASRRLRPGGRRSCRAGRS